MTTCTYTFQTAEGEKTITGMDSMKAFLALNGMDSIIEEDASFKRSAFFSMGTGSIISLNRSKSQVPARRLNTALSKYFRHQKWSDAFEAVDVPNALSSFAEEVKTAFGTNVQYVAPRSEKYNIFLGVQLPSIANTIFVNATSQVNMTTIAGHEIYHVIEKTRPDLHEWFKTQAEQYFQNVKEYRDRLNSMVQEGESAYDDEDTKIELLADFTGDAISDPAFLQKLANDDPSRFKGLLNAIIDFISQAITKLQNLGSSKYISEVEALRDDLRKVIKAFNNGDSIENVALNVQSFSQTNQTNTDAFKRWFGDSKVVDENGEPLVVYHGTPNGGFSTFSEKTKGTRTRHDPSDVGFHFTDSADYAEAYSEGYKLEAIEKYREIFGEEPGAIKLPSGASTYAVYLRINNPMLVKSSKLINSSLIEQAKEQGKDGIISTMGDAREYVVFNPNQIKSAIGNNGNFDGGNDNILFSRQSPLNQEWESLNDSGKLKNLQYAFQDKYADLKDVTKAIKETGREIVDSLNAYLQEELYHGRVAKRIQDFTRNELEPLLNGMQEAGVSMPDLEMYLWARHAPERNRQIAKINPDNKGLQDGGSGMTTQEAEDYILGLAPAAVKKLETLADIVDAINKRTRNLLLAYGIEDMNTVAKMEQTYEHYVPLMRDIGGNVEGGFGTGQGFSIKGNSTKRAMGSTKPVVDIIANIAAQREKFIVRGEKNRVATALIGLAITNPKEDFWTVDSPPKMRYVDKATGYVEETIDPNYKNRNNVVVARFLNKQGKVVERALVFNEKDQRSLRLAESIKNLDVDGMEDWLRSMGAVTRYFASVNTQYNPIFGIVNITRDVQGALINLESTEIAGKQNDVLSGIFPAMAGIWKSLRAERNGGQAEGNWQQLWEEYQREGGQTGYREMFAKASDRTKKLNRIIDPMWWTKTKFGKLITINNAQVAQAEKFLADKANQWIFENLSDYNQTLENAVRLSAYKVALDSGLTKQQAASLGKNLTVNFNRKGAAGARMGALYAFFNASAQGTARIAETMFRDGKLSRTGKIVIQGGVILGVMQALALVAAGFGDDDPPEFERDRNIILPIGGGKYFKLAMPLGYHIIPSTARRIVEFMMGNNKTPAELIAGLGTLYADALNPLGGGSFAQVITPTALDPAMSLYANEDGLGRRIYQEKFSPSDTTAGYLRARDTANALSKSLAYAINIATGGSEYTEGVLSPTPDQISFLAEQVGGGVAREVMKSGDVASSMIDGTALPTYRIPLVGRFYGDASSKTSHAHEFYNNMERMDRHKREIQGRIQDGREIDEYIKDHPEAVLWKQGQLISNAVRKLRQRRDSMISAGEPRKNIEDIESLIDEREARFNELVKETAKQP